jgi:hypothetical protein
MVDALALPRALGESSRRFRSKPSVRQHDDVLRSECWLQADHTEVRAFVYMPQTISHFVRKNVHSFFLSSNPSIG